MTARVFDNCRLEYEDGVVRLRLDVQGASDNRISEALIEDLHAALDALQTEGAAPPLILCSNKPSGFAAGLDPAELARLTGPAGAESLVARGQALVTRLLAWPQPTAALLHGNCLGGGLEIALAARYRIAEDAAGTGLGFPENHLGLHPCFGGSARLADLIGMSPALDLAIQGRILPAAEALRLGLVDACASPDGVADSAVDLLQRDPGERRPRGLRRVLSLAPIRWLREVIRVADDREPIVPESHPATMAMRELWRRGRRSPRSRGSR